MRELVFVQPGSRAEGELSRAAEEALLHREFTERLAECGPLAYRVAQAVLRNPAEAEDVAQEAMVRAFRQFERLRDRGKFRAWLVRIAFRLALDRARSARRREQRETRWSAPEHARAAPTAEELAAAGEFELRVELAMDELPEKQRLALVLSAIRGHTLEEVARLTGVPVGTVKSRIFQARKQLAEKLRCHVTNTKTR